MAYPQNKYRNKAVVLLVKCGLSFYAISKALGRKDKRYLMVIWERDRNLYDLPEDNKPIHYYTIKKSRKNNLTLPKK